MAQGIQEEPYHNMPCGKQTHTLHKQRLAVSNQPLGRCSGYILLVMRMYALRTDEILVWVANDGDVHALDGDVMIMPRVNWDPETYHTGLIYKLTKIENRKSI